MFFAVLLIFILFRMELLDLPGETIYEYEVTIALAANKMKGNWLIIKFYTILFLFLKILCSYQSFLINNMFFLKLGFVFNSRVCPFIVTVSTDIFIFTSVFPTPPVLL